jgi:activator of HSP90 ATPase
MNTKTIKQSVVINNANPHEIYELLMNSKKHTELINSKSTISPKVGGKFKIYDGYIEGTNIMLEKDKKIVQKWRGEEDCWPKDHYSILKIQLEKVESGTKLTLKQSEVPEECYDSFYKGWYDFYWKPMQEMFKSK